ncbi:hypothetical protein GCM10027088_45350 [Nocardia goodfellowii]
MGLFCAAGTAGAQPRSLLPEVGQTFDLSLNAFGATLVVDLPPPLPALNFIGSRVVEVVPGGSDHVRLRVLHFIVEAAHPLFGKIVMRAPEDDPGSGSVLKSVAGGRLVETWQQDITITFEKCGDCAGPFIFRTRRPGQWSAELAEFPPPPQGMHADGSPTGGVSYRLSRSLHFTAVRDTACEPCPLSTPMPGGSGDYAILENLDFHQGNVPR